MKDTTDYTGQRYGCWIVLRRNFEKIGGNQHWMCRCDCGNEQSRPINNLKRGVSKSCGCGAHKSAKITHAMHGTPEWRSWAGMKQRCYSTKWRFYGNYGGRGIKVCRFLLESPVNLVSAVGSCPDGKGWSIDRIATDGHYSCGSCLECMANAWPLNIQWATKKEQARNKRNNAFVLVNGQKMTKAEIAEKAGISQASVNKRVRKWDCGRDLLQSRCDSRA